MKLKKRITKFKAEYFPMPHNAVWPSLDKSEITAFECCDMTPFYNNFFWRQIIPCKFWPTVIRKVQITIINEP